MLGMSNTPSDPTDSKGLDLQNDVKVYQSFSLILSIYISFPMVSEQTFAILFKILSIDSN